MNLKYYKAKDFNPNNYSYNLIVRSRKEAENTKIMQLPLKIGDYKDNTFDKVSFYQEERQVYLDIQIKQDTSSQTIKKFALKSADDILQEKPETLAIYFTKNRTEREVMIFLTHLLSALNPFNKYQKSGISNDIVEKNTDQLKLDINLYCEDPINENTINQAINRAEYVTLARNLVNEPANVMTPSKLAEIAENVSLENNLEVEVLGENDIKSLKMEAFLSVAQGSIEEPKLIVIRLNNNSETDKKIALVGKGVTYDTGGYAIKPASGMLTMHSDMAGSAAVIAAINLLAKNKAKVNAVAIVAATENMISDRAYKNGDIISSMSGKNIEVINTDAEGRLTLADAIWYAHDIEKADHIVDIATLTGAVYAALGDSITGVITDDNNFYKSLQKASEYSGDKIWQLPCDEDLAKCNESKRADIRNSGNCGAGTTTAALFLRSFANNKPWTHLDIAGTAYKTKGASNPEGATGVGVELLADAVIDFFNNLK